MSHNDAVREQFRVQASTFTDTGFAVAGLDWIVAGLEPGPRDVVLDVAAGAAHLGRALAPHVLHVSALDLTPEMLEQGRLLADGLRNITFLQGDASALPWCGGQFDLCVCRLTLHQVADPAAVVREMVRVSRGRVAVIDMTLTDPSVAEETNRLERLRDPSHGRTLTIAETHALLAEAGAAVEATVSHDNVVDIEDWLERTETPAPARAAIHERFEEELAGGPPTGLRPTGEGTFVHTWTMTVARV